MEYNNRQLDDSVLAEVTLICTAIAKNEGGIRITVSPVSEKVLAATRLTHVMDVDDFAFFYPNESDALADQIKLCTHLRVRGLVVAKVYKQKPISLAE